MIIIKMTRDRHVKVIIILILQIFKGEGYRTCVEQQRVVEHDTRTSPGGGGGASVGLLGACTASAGERHHAR
jgi:hypothetical protein